MRTLMQVHTMWLTGLGHDECFIKAEFHTDQVKTDIRTSERRFKRSVLELGSGLINFSAGVSVYDAFEKLTVEEQDWFLLGDMKILPESGSELCDDCRDRKHLDSLCEVCTRIAQKSYEAYLEYLEDQECSCEVDDVCYVHNTCRGCGQEIEGGYESHQCPELEDWRDYFDPYGHREEMRALAEEAKLWNPDNDDDLPF